MDNQIVPMSQAVMLKRMAGARWLNQLSREDKTALAELSIRYNLDPVMGELTVYEGRPFISVSGYSRLAHQQPTFAGLEDRPMSQDERDAYGIRQPIGWITRVYRRGWRVPAVGTGAADPDRPFRNNPVERERPQWMARSRAIRQALKLAYPHALPFAQFESAEEQGRYVDTTTGEVIEGEIVGETPTPQTATASPTPAATTATTTPANGRASAAPTAATKAPGKPAGASPKALARWEELLAEASAAGITGVAPLPENPSYEQIRDRAARLKDLIARTQQERAAEVSQQTATEQPSGDEASDEQVPF